jgi:ribosomal protein S18 acetylase RimI-like enzyme
VGNFCVGKVGNNNAAAMILQWQDFLFWPQFKADESGFIHKLCVRRNYSGQGLSCKMVAYAIEECKKKDIRYLRLDTGWHRQKLCDLYESLGFVKVGKKTIGDMDYALYEMKIIKWK